MQFTVDLRSPTPPSEQLADAVRFAVSAGRLAPGDQLPSVRDVAKDARVNPNTVGRAWRELEFDGIVESRRGLGTFIANGAVRAARRACEVVVTERLERAVRDALAAGFEPHVVIELCRAAARPDTPEEEAA